MALTTLTSVATSATSAGIATLTAPSSPSIIIASVASKDACQPGELGDPDITGFGVLISFLFPIFLVLVTIIGAYLKDILPRKCYNEFDNLILNREPRDKDGPRVRKLQSFVLAMSDQQLFSGLALVIAINVIRNGVQGVDEEVTSFAYVNAVMLAFFSCIVHLATIAVLRDDLRDRQYLKHFRVAVMICVAVLLLQSLVESWTMDTDHKLRCAIKELRFLHFSHEKLHNWADVTGLIVMLGLLASGYIRRIRELYNDTKVSEADRLAKSWPVSIMAKTIGWPQLSGDNIVEAKRRLASTLSSKRNSSESYNSDIERTLRILLLVVPANFQQSFLFEVIWLVFYVAFAVCQLATTLSVDIDDGNDHFNSITFKPSFGQLLPLILVGLPFLAMAEGYSELNADKEQAPHLSADGRLLHSPQGSGPSRPSHPPPASHEAAVDPREVTKEEKDVEFLTARDAHTLLVRVYSIVFSIGYFLVCIFISLAIGQNWCHPTYDSASKIDISVISAFAAGVLFVAVGGIFNILRLLELRKELQGMQRLGGCHLGSA
ncbi:hypothetical protein B0H67DRAFT_594534 [Lasiosphaeris hirsuta]|uniref:Uncharacterized protein n=1 Tax=Lasiosphaeris hirsuta TaxID=260670 RepID=A0AA39ZXV6_9PEZI|nr:hypothetical protein B0H67DRAFT_594534 [Lasiosphaeris hirsuta]